MHGWTFQSKIAIRLHHFVFLKANSANDSISTMRRWLDDALLIATGKTLSLKRLNES